MSQDNLAPLECTICKRKTHNTTRNRKIKVRLALSKFCRFCKKHTEHKETK
ncbi:50S ribosomal protein L33 [Candidatus Uhrbacteria bacterium]|nr:50S ribosomal protein L33 [Candidatus Uhrbacteria bacterium]